MLRFIGNVIWLLLAGLPLAIGYAAFGLLAFILIITIPFGIVMQGSQGRCPAPRGPQPACR
jgi:uncharacterized membrane protein YccF (DUF307 family)